MTPPDQGFHTPISSRYTTNNAEEIFLVNGKFTKILTNTGLFSDFDEVWNYPGGEFVKKKDNRTVYRVSLEYPQSDKKYSADQPRLINFFIKRHSEPLNSWRRRHQKWQGEGVREYYNYCDFRKKGLATALPVAAGMKRTPSTLQSFLVTMDFSPLYSLEEVILNKPEKLRSQANEKTRRNILKAIASYARQMHDNGVNHKDFNATHILLDNIGSPEPAVALFDLQHVDRKRTNRFRWPIKALAELNVSLPESVFTEEDRLFLFHGYKGKNCLDLIDKIQYHWIMKKADRIRRHTRKNNLAPKDNDI